MKLKTGVMLLDDMLRGGLETGATTLISSKPFTEATPLAYQVAYRWLDAGYPVIYLTNNKRSGYNNGGCEEIWVGSNQV